MKRSVFLIFAILHSVMMIASMLFEAACLLEISIPKFAVIWVDFIPCAIIPLVNFLMLFFAALKSKLSPRKINVILEFDIILRALYILTAVIFVFPTITDPSTLIYLITLTIAMTVLCLGGAVAAKIVVSQNEKKVSS